MLATYAEELKEAFFPYVEPVATVLIPLIKFVYLDDVRIASMASMPVLLAATAGALKAGAPGATPEAVGMLKNAMFGPIIEQLKARGIGVIITDHNVRETLSICDRAYIIKDGTILRLGTPAEIAEDPEVREVYLGKNFSLN